MLYPSIHWRRHGQEDGDCYRGKAWPNLFGDALIHAHSQKSDGVGVERLEVMLTIAEEDYLINISKRNEHAIANAGALEQG